MTLILFCLFFDFLAFAQLSSGANRSLNAISLSSNMDWKKVCGFSPSMLISQALAQVDFELARLLQPKVLAGCKNRLEGLRMWSTLVL